ncbi:MAG TPA: SgcJ/EcaC family oxidoreductase [Amycolatopsis sp.]|nr:SgcJ/EcaC family oxidoreductase [Amycolatopsis sp.]
MTGAAASPSARSADLDEIRALSAHYVRHIDDGDADAAADLFATDGVWDGSAAGLPIRNGRDAIREGFANAAAPRYIHLTGNHVITFLDDDHAEGTEHAMAVHFAAGGDLALSLSLLTDRYIRTGDGWRFASRSLRSLGRAKLAAAEPAR